MTTNQQRAAEVLGFRELEDAKRYARDDTERLAAALDAVEARGRAEVAAKVEALAAEFEGRALPWQGELADDFPLHAAARLRALAEEASA